MTILLGILILPKWQDCTEANTQPVTLVQRQYKPDSTPNYYRSFLWKRFDELIDFALGVVQVRGDPEAITTRRRDDISRGQVRIERHC